MTKPRDVPIVNERSAGVAGGITGAIIGAPGGVVGIATGLLVGFTAGTLIGIANRYRTKTIGREWRRKRR